MTESSLQQQIYNFFHNTYCLKYHNPRLLIHSTPNGGTRNKMEAITMKATGLVSGIADLTIKLPNSFFIDVEVKTEKGIQSPNQKDIQKILEDMNCNYIIVRSLDDFKMKVIPIINKYLLSLQNNITSDNSDEKY